jgi:pimeloyl-ACP methyl ester carboxylesterase
MGKYALRRIVGTEGSWKSGLKAAWGDPAKVSDGDVLRFSWPSIGENWEEGILNFASAQGLPQEDELDDDRTLLQRVLDLPNTKVVVVLGSKDRVVPSTHVKKFMENFDRKDRVPIIELDGLGHDAFEEDTEAFCDAVDQLLKSHWDVVGEYQI